MIVDCGMRKHCGLMQVRYRLGGLVLIVRCWELGTWM